MGEDLITLEELRKYFNDVYLGSLKLDNLDFSKLRYVTGASVLPGGSKGGEPYSLLSKPTPKPTPDYGAIAQTGAAFAGSLYNGTIYGRSAGDLLLDSGRTTQYQSGIGYDALNYVNADKEMSMEHRENVGNTLKSVGTGAAFGASIGSVIPGFGTALGAAVGGVIGGLGGLFGSGKRHATSRGAIALANERAWGTNNFNRSVAWTQGLLNDYYSNNIDTKNGMLSAKEGKDIGTVGKFKNVGMVETANGKMVGPLNAWASAGEGIYNPMTGAARLVTHGPNDTAKANLKSEDVVYGDLTNPETGNTFKKDAAQYVLAKETLNKKRPKTNDQTTLKVYEAVSKPLANALDAKLNDLADTLSAVRQYNEYGDFMKAKYGKDCKFPGYKEGKPYMGWLPNALVGALGVGIGLDQYFDAKRQDIYRPNTYVPNPLYNRAQRTLDNLRISSYPISRLMRDAATQADRRIDMSGGLSGALKYLARIANYTNLYNNIANMNSSIQQLNNAYKSNAASTMLLAGAAEASNRMNAMRADNDIYMKSHAARLGGMQTGLFNISNALQAYIANDLKRRIGRGTIGVYNTDLINYV